ncbi:MAG TPA: ABC transporter ATP-binding protein [Thermotogota bacterium]|mgnify:CR=1 FL=1|nr:ABC transporter ATP-binding protein [Thermotogota bacterium]HRW92790.1 ABC transporter ATP-binding protein [Thermotogota bacterium]
MIEISNVTFGYDTKPLFEGLSLRIPRRKIFGIIGPNGSGKSTLVKLILGLLKPWSGEIRVDGQRVGSIPRKQLARLVSAVLQDFSPAYDFTVEEIVSMGRTPYLGFLGSERVSDASIVARSLERADLCGFEEHVFQQLSGGEKQRVLIAKCFAQQTPVLLLDEFVAHLDPGHVQQLMEQVSLRNREEGTCVVGVFHEINLASLFCDQIAVFQSGKLVSQGTPGEVLDADLIQRVYGVRALVIPHPVVSRPQVLYPPPGTKAPG